MVGLGLFERPDMVIFAETGAEPEEINRIVARDREYADSIGIPFYVTKEKYGPLDTLPERKNQISAPAFTVDVSTGKKGTLLRTCTHEFKIAPIRQELRRHGVKSAEMWLGITTDEITRVKPSPNKWVTHRWPFIEMNWSRTDCINLLADLGVNAQKSACYMCPYRSKAGYEGLTENDRQNAIKYDEKIRDLRPGFKTYLHPTCVPLEDALATQAKQSTFVFDEEDECSGNCFL